MAGQDFIYKHQKYQETGCPAVLSEVFHN